jgi:hypothetical protein
MAIRDETIIQVFWIKLQADTCIRKNPEAHKLASFKMVSKQNIHPVVFTMVTTFVLTSHFCVSQSYKSRVNAIYYKKVCNLKILWPRVSMILSSILQRHTSPYQQIIFLATDKARPKSLQVGIITSWNQGYHTGICIQGSAHSLLWTLIQSIWARQRSTFSCRCQRAPKRRCKCGLEASSLTWMPQQAFRYDTYRCRTTASRTLEITTKTTAVYPAGRRPVIEQLHVT